MRKMVNLSDSDVLTDSVDNDKQHIEWLKKAKNDKNISIEAYDKIMWKNINKVLELRL